MPISRPALASDQQDQLISNDVGDQADAGKKEAGKKEAGREAEAACRYVETASKKAKVDNVLLAKAESCATYVETTFPEPTGKVKDDIKKYGEWNKAEGSGDIDDLLITSHFRNRLLKLWAKKAVAEKVGTADGLLARIDRIDLTLHPMLKADGLLELMAGSVVAGPAFGVTGKQSAAAGTSTGAATTSTTGTAASSSASTPNSLAHIEFGSQHFGAENWLPVEFSFGGSFGVQPALTLLKSAPGAAAPIASTSQYQSAFVWDLNSKVHKHIGSNAEGSAYGRVGQIHLLTGNGATIVDQGANSTLTIPLNSGADQASWFTEFGTEFNLYDKALEVVHGEMSQLSPLFNVALGYRFDNRFRQSNLGAVSFDSPDRRLVFRFMVNGLKIFDRRPDTTRTKPFDVSFGVEREQGFGSNPLPGGTKILIHADIALLKLINPGGSN